MRLSLFEVETIINFKNKIFGKNSKIYLFGSRVNDSEKGGDIDLFVQTVTKEDIFEKKIRFLSELHQVLGEQKIDIVFSVDGKRSIEVMATAEGIELDIEKIKLGKYFQESEKHLQRIEEAYSDIEGILPLTAQKYQQLGRHEVQAIDQYLFRFAKLQDTLGDKIFKLIIARYEQTSEALPFIDILNRLEKMGFIASAKEWIKLRKIRNEISHQYDDEPEEMAQAINVIMSQKEVIRDIFLRMADNYEKFEKEVGFSL